jgi:tRNA-specific 2-thiouridylase
MPHTPLTFLPPSHAPWDRGGSGREIAVLMSGGVDSSVAALRLQQAGWRVLGVTMKVPVAPPACPGARPCCGADAAVVCHHIGVPHYYLDCRDAFHAHVIEPFRQAYRKGLTPNPCVDCNTRLKFTLVWDAIEARFGIRHLATGHYARVLHEAGEHFLARGADRRRDQSYFIYGVPRERLERFVLPNGAESKEAIRGLARDHGLPVAEKADSQELCFAGEDDYRRALGDEAGTEPGPIVDTAGTVVGRHEGIAHYTLGQRRGLGVAFGEPMYVVGLRAEDNAVVVGTRAEASRQRVRASEANILIPGRLRIGERLVGKTRSVGEPAPCTVPAAGEGALAVEFDAPQFGPAAGQRLVLYDARERVVAGGTIQPYSQEAHARAEQTVVDQDHPPRSKRGERHRQEDESHA